MKTKRILIMVLLIFLTGSPPAFGEPFMPEPNWDRGMAMKVVASTDTRTALAPLFELARNGDNESLQQAIEAIGKDESLADPARDYLLYTFTSSLSDLQAQSVSSETIDSLFRYKPKTLVAHDDNSSVGVPLFNVRAAAAGVQQAWERQTGSQLALRLDPETPSIWIQRYLEATPAARRGFIDSLNNIGHSQLLTLGWAAIAVIQQQPDLTPVAAFAGTRSGDLELTWQSILSGKAAELPATLRMAADHFDPAECAELLGRGLALESHTSRSLAIAQLGPASLSEQKSQDALFNELDNPELGAGAALVLSGSNDPQIVERLNGIAEDKQSLASQRARLAINLRQTEAGSVQ